MEVTSQRKKTRGASVSQSDRQTDRQSAHCFLLETEVRLSPRAAATPTLQGHFHASARRLQTDAKQPAQLSKVARSLDSQSQPPPTTNLQWGTTGPVFIVFLQSNSSKQLKTFSH